MTLEVWTARIGCRDADVLDITRKSGGPEGQVFAPSWAILRPALDARQKATRLREIADALTGIVREVHRMGTLQSADDIERRAWAAYVPAYLAEMRVSYRAHRPVWDALAARSRIVLVCYCAPIGAAPLRCHRVLLGRDILPKIPTLGAVYRGELPAAQGRLLGAG